MTKTTLKIKVGKKEFDIPEEGGTITTYKGCKIIIKKKNDNDTIIIKDNDGSKMSCSIIPGATMILGDIKFTILNKKK